MTTSDDAQRRDEFETFLRASEERLRVALTASFGVVDGRTAALDALSWAWEHWPRVREMDNPVGYLYRVGQTAARKNRPRPIPIIGEIVHTDQQRIAHETATAIGRLSDQQRTVVTLVHAFGWTVRDVADVLDIAPSSVQTHSERGLSRLRDLLEESHAH